MKSVILRRRHVILFLGIFALLVPALCAAGNRKPKLIVVVVIDQFRGDYLERYRDKFGPDGFRMLMDRGAWFTECYYNYANLQTAPGHSTIGTGAYTNGHGIAGNDWYDASRDEQVTSVFDANTTLVGQGGGGPGASPHNLQADTFGDELRLFTKGASRVFAVSLKDRSAILPAGYSANAAYWIEKYTGGIQTSSYYMKELPAWVQKFNVEKHTEKYWEQDWKDEKGNVLRKTAHPTGGANLGFYDIVGATPYANDYEFEFTRELVQQEKLGQGEATDVLLVSVSAFDILGHQVGPDSPQLEDMAIKLDRQLANFWAFLGKQIGLADVWIVLTADHGITYMPDSVTPLKIPALRHWGDNDFGPLNLAISKKFPKFAANEYVKGIQFPYVYLSKERFEAAGMKDEQKAEQLVGDELMKLSGVREYFTRAQIARGEFRHDETGEKIAHSYTPITTWYVQVRFAPFVTDYKADVSHGAAYSYDQHVPLMFFGLPFQAGIYRNTVEPVDLAVTITSLLGINKPTSAVGRSLVEAITPQYRKADVGEASGKEKK
jgi:arylsulfatase A-like enzyme